MPAAADLDALFAEVPDDNESPTGAPAAAGTESTAPETPAETKLADFDALVPSDAADVDERFRGKSVGELLRVATQHAHQLGEAQRKSQLANEYESRARMAENTLAWLRGQIEGSQQAQPRAPQEPAETDQDLLDRLAQNPTKVLPQKIAEQLNPVAERLRELEYREVERDVAFAANTAREQVRTALGMDPASWEMITPQLAAITAARGYRIDDPDAWWYAAQELRQHSQVFAPRQPAPAPVEVPRPAAPGVGTARSSARPGVVTRLKGRDKENAADLLSAFGIKEDSPRYADFENFVATRKGTD